ncbi:hypothetical protein [Prochlorococcus sp. MIT 1341]|uniref:hypothetical protein n=1 Tax=Prochlorococcus sp. MIT 1341 TaxID=3096221 RepID=UPI002A74DD86|nr:hypothetical protein [Prochlorococcus sp. MIT 1341]
MNIPPPETRKCSQCARSLSLNLFKQNSEICRYCDHGSQAPELKQVRNGSISIDSSNLTGKSDLINSSTLIEKTNNIVKEKTPKSGSNKPGSPLTKTSLDLFESHLPEIALIKGCSIRWNDAKLDSSKILEFIKDSENYNSQNNNEVNPWNELIDRIDSLYVDATVIKSSIRTLLRMPLNIRERILKFIRGSLEDQSKSGDAINTLSNDLLKDSIELGYPIPLIPLPDHDELASIKRLDRSIEILTIRLGSREIADYINNKKFIFSRNEFENDIIEKLCRLYKDNHNVEDQIQLTKKISSSINLIYRLYGLNLDAFDSVIDVS